MTVVVDEDELVACWLIFSGKSKKNLRKKTQEKQEKTLSTQKALKNKKISRKVDLS